MAKTVDQKHSQVKLLKQINDIHQLEPGNKRVKEDAKASEMGLILILMHMSMNDQLKTYRKKKQTKYSRKDQHIESYINSPMANTSIIADTSKQKFPLPSVCFTCGLTFSGP